MPNINGGRLVHVGPVPKAKFGAKVKNATKPHARRAKHFTDSVRGNATSAKSKNYRTGEKIGKPPKEKGYREALNETMENPFDTSTLEHATNRLGGKIYAGMAGGVGGGMIGTSLADRKAKKRVSKRYYRITDVGTKAASRYPYLPTKTILGAGGATGTLSYVSADKNHKAAEAKKRRKKTMTQTTPVRKNTMLSAFGVDHGAEVSKAKQKKASAGRQALGTVFGPYHGAVAGKKGHKLRAMGNQLGGSMAGGIAGSAVGQTVARKSPGAATALAMTGSYGGALAGTRRAQRVGHFKREK